jgi:hypothetical protein
MATPPILSRTAILAGSIVHRLTHAAAWTLRHVRELQRHELEDGSTVPAIHGMPVAGSQWGRFDALTDGDCLPLKSLSWWAEVHYHSRTHEAAPGCAI